MTTPIPAEQGEAMDYDEAPFPEPFGDPVYALPPGEPCPDCKCCTRRLCEQAREQGIPCSLVTDAPALVAGCGCSDFSDQRGDDDDG